MDRQYHEKGRWDVWGALEFFSFLFLPFLSVSLDTAINLLLCLSGLI